MLLFVSLETFLMLLSSIIVLLRLNASRDKLIFVSQFRSLPNAPDFITGGVGINGTATDIASFVVAAVGFYIIGLILAYRVYRIRRELALVVLTLNLILLLFLIAVSNILLVIRS